MEIKDNGERESDLLERSNAPKVEYQELLKMELKYRCHKNPQYSMRAFARDLKLSFSGLSQILNRKRGLSPHKTAMVIGCLQLNEIEKNIFLLSVKAQHERSIKQRIVAQKELELLVVNSNFDKIDLESFRMICDWHHFAILELTDLSDFKSNERWIARKLGLDVLEVRDAIQRLLHLGYLIYSDNGRLVQTTQDLATPSEIPSREIRSNHHQILNKAKVSIDEDILPSRDFSSVTLSFPTERIQEAKQMIKRFRRQFNQVFQDKNYSKDRVYCLAVQLFPLDKEI